MIAIYYWAISGPTVNGGDFRHTFFSEGVNFMKTEIAS